MPHNNIGGTSKLAKYKTLRNLLQERKSRQANPNSANTGEANLSPNNFQKLNNIKQQLDLKIREEEQRAEMFARQRLEMEMRMGQEHAKQLPVEKKN